MKSLFFGFKLQKGVRTDLATGEVIETKPRVQEKPEVQEDDDFYDVTVMLKRWRAKSEAERLASQKGGRK